MFVSLIAYVSVFIAGTQCTPQSTQPEINEDNVNRFGGQQHQNAINQERFNYFDRELLQKIVEKETGNVIISSASVKTVLSLLLEAAEGNSYNELRSLLRLPENQTAALEELHKFQQALLGSYVTNRAVTVKSASRIFVSREYNINQDFQNLLQQHYKSGITHMNVMNPEVTAADINSWVKMFTNGLIPSLLDPSMIGPDTHMILTNAIYFKGTWLKEFSEPATIAKCFHSQPNTCTSTYMMTQLGEYNYGYVENLDSQVVQLLYDDTRYSMVLILPNKRDGIGELTRDIVHKTIPEILPLLKKTEVLVTIPRFSAEFNIELKPILEILGVREIFTDASNLPKLSTQKKSKIGAVIHKAKIVVNEKGTEAGAGTGAAVIPLMSSYTPEFIADHPFYFFIYDEHAQTVLFSGRLNTVDEVSQADRDRPQSGQPQLANDQLQPLSSGTSQINKRPSQPVSFPAQSNPYPPTGNEKSRTDTFGQRYESNNQPIRRPSSSTQNGDKIYFNDQQ